MSCSIFACFNPRSREGNDCTGDTGNKNSAEFQSTFPRGERQWACKHRGSCAAVSIHVPARGTTLYSNAGWNNAWVSIHVPARGTTLVRYISDCIGMFQSTFPRGERLALLYSFSGLRLCFNPRSREGNDLYRLAGFPLHRAVSIHVPARGTTIWINRA